MIELKIEPKIRWYEFTDGEWEQIKLYFPKNKKQVYQRDHSGIPGKCSTESSREASWQNLSERYEP